MGSAKNKKKHKERVESRPLRQRGKALNKGGEKMAREERYIISIDTGGTFSDAVIVKSNGSVVTGKALTTPEKLENCFFACIQAGCEKMDKSLKEALSSTDEISYGTTVGTNIMVTGTGGPKLGFITTRGHEDLTVIGRLRSAGLTPEQAMHIVTGDGPKPLIPRPLIKGVTERVDSMGDEVIPLREEEARRAVKELVDEGVEGIAVGFLWPFLNNAHEVRVREIIQEIATGMPVSISSEVAPTIREYPRFISTIIDLYIGKPLRKLLSGLEAQLKEYSYVKPLLVMQAIGGVSQARIVKPATTLHSGPVGGLLGVEFMKGVYGYKNAMGSDVGGTSFDVTVSPEKGEEYLREPRVGRWEIANPMREIITIGAGGGTIAWVDKITETLHLGPQSAGAFPGPVCLGRGGTEPTVTDADVAMGRIDVNYFLGGKIKLDREKATAAIKEKIADPLKMDVMQAAEAICNIIDGAMKATLKSTVAIKGIGPEQYVLFCFGGAGPTHCAGYSAGLGFHKVIVTPLAAVFSAFGASTADIRHRYEGSPWLLMATLPYDITSLRFDLDQLKSLDQVPRWVPERFNKMFDNLERRAYQEMEEEGFKRKEITLKYELLARYGGQLWEIRCPCPVNRINSIEDLKLLIKAFEEEYIKIYTKQAIVPRGGIEIVSISLLATAPTVKPIIVKHDYVGNDPSKALKGKRDVYFEGKWLKTKVYEMDTLQVGNVISGPSVIERIDTTMVVPKGCKVTVDEYLNMVMEYE